MKLQRAVLVAVVVVLVGGLAYWGWQQNQAEDESNSDVKPTPMMGQRVLEGNLGCLPKKGPGPHTLECAIGLQTAEGDYQLNGQGLDASWSMDYTFNDLLRVEGEVVEADDQGGYDAVGKMIIEEIELLEASS